MEIKNVNARMDRLFTSGIAHSKKKTIDVSVEISKNCWNSKISWASIAKYIKEHCSKSDFNCIIQYAVRLIR